MEYIKFDDLKKNNEILSFGIKIKLKKKNQFQYILDEVAESVNPDRD
jgi:hypothetical protein